MFFTRATITPGAALARRASMAYTLLKARYDDNVTVHFELGRHEMESKCALVEDLFHHPDLDQDSWEVVHDELHIFKNDFGKFFTLVASAVEVQDDGRGQCVAPWNVFTERQKRRRESRGLIRPISWEFTH